MSTDARGFLHNLRIWLQVQNENTYIIGPQSYYHEILPKYPKKIYLSVGISVQASKNSTYSKLFVRRDLVNKRSQIQNRKELCYQLL